ncbi:DUF6221 family protein [Streptomyces sp. NPDC057236]|uniref:DUF6221 family protein n=1 Tax=Streptomyces sp. NPDC057236 TaxID=3346059 RepID=UPI00362E4760
MGDLVEWLRAQLDEDERIARATDKTLGQGHLRWGAQPVDDAFSRVLTGRGWVVGTGEFKPEDAEYIAEWDPDRVLREIDAKRQVLKAYDKAVQTVEELSAVRDRLHARGQDLLMTEMDLESAIHRRDTLSGVLRLLALPYADRPGYRKEWRP